MNEIISWITGLLAVLIPGIGAAPEPVYNGYVEANYVYAAATNPGRLTEITVKEGDTVAAGDLLFALDDDQYRAALKATIAQQAASEATWRNLKTGSRVEETDVIRASLKQAEANQALAETTLERSLKLQRNGLVPDAQVDSNRAQFEAANASVAQLKAQLAVADLPARPEQLAAAKANYDAATANMQSAKVQFEDRKVEAPVGGKVDRVFYRSGEVVGVGSPVVSILPPDELKVEFFVPEAERATLHVGDRLDLSCDGCADGLTGTVSYLASKPQNTPPIIFSRDERGRLVFMAEAKIADGSELLPGQPVSMKVPE